MQAKKAQLGIEFLVILSAALFFLLLILSAIYSNVFDKQNEKELEIIKNLALNIKEEIDIAYTTSNGYSREFNVPENLNGKDYEISIINNYIYIDAGKNAVSYKIKNVTGFIQKGGNLIKKENEKIYLNG